MANNVTKVDIPVASPAKSKLDLSCDHVTTMNFGECQPVHYRHPLKGETINLGAVGTVRPMPMACPTYGRMRLNLHHFYVPYSVIFPQYDSFANDTIAVNSSNSSLIDEAPKIKNSDIVNTFLTSLGGVGIYAQSLGTWSSGDAFDFVIDPDSIAANHYRFTTWGKFFFKVLTSLGYAINWDSKDNTYYSALPLLAYAKVYLDYYANQSYLDSADVIAIKQMLAYNDPVTPLTVSASQFAIISQLIKNCVYEPDYFVGAWDNPWAPNSGQYSAITFSDIYSNATVATTSNGTPLMAQTAATSTSLGTQYLHDALKAITDYSKRHQLAGATNINRAIAQYGFGVTRMKYDRALHLGSSSIDVNTGAVFSTANTASAGNVSTLGDYAGNGFGQGNSSFNYTVEEAGIQITIGSIMPSGGYYQGMDENNMHIAKLQFFTPEFDGLGVQSIRKREVYTSNNGSFGRLTGTVRYDETFGMTGRYGEYKRPRSWVSGDLRCPTRMDGGDAWHLMRRFEDSSFTNGISDLHHSLDFTRIIDNNQYRRIFTDTNTDNDPFIVELHFDVHSVAPCHGLFETYEFDSEGKRVTLDANGSTLN